MVKKEWFFFWEIVQSISLFLKILRQNFQVTLSDLFINTLYQNQYDFVEIKSFKTWKHIPQQPDIREQDILNATPNIEIEVHHEKKEKTFIFILFEYVIYSKIC